MSRLSRVTISAIVGLQVIFWVAVALWSDIGPWATQDSRQTVEATGTGNVIVIQLNDQLQFVPTEITINAGDTVEWRNVGAIPHTVTADPGRAPSSKNIELPDGGQAFDSGWLTAGQSFRYTFGEAGVYRYVCLPHEQAQMIGAVIIG